VSEELSDTGVADAFASSLLDHEVPESALAPSPFDGPCHD